MPVYRSQTVINHPALGGVGTNTWHFRTTGPSETESEIELELGLTALHTFYDTVGPLMASGTQFDCEGIWTRVDEEGAQIFGTAFASGPHSGGDPMAPQDCLVVGWGSAVPGRRRRGRTFLSPLGIPVLQDNGTPDESARTTVVEAAEALIETFDEPGDGAFGIWSNLDEAHYDFTRARVANRFGSLRSRRD